VDSDDLFVDYLLSIWLPGIDSTIIPIFI